MKHVVFSIRDSAVGAFMRPFTAAAQGAAVRSFMDEVQRSDSEMGKHPKDYEMFRLGTFDDESGRFDQEEFPVSVMRAVDVLQVKE